MLRRIEYTSALTCAPSGPPPATSVSPAATAHRLSGRSLGLGGDRLHCQEPVPWTPLTSLPHDHHPRLAPCRTGKPTDALEGDAPLAVLRSGTSLPAVCYSTATSGLPLKEQASSVPDEVFDDPVSDERAEAVLNRLAQDDGMELWVAEAAGRTVSAGRLEPVPPSPASGAGSRARSGAVAASTAR